MTIPSVILNIDTMGQKIKLFINENGMSMAMNGETQSIPMGNIEQMPLFGSPMKITMSKTGKVTGFDMAGLESLTKMLGNMDFSQMLKANQNEFPDHPIKVGESWSTTVKIPMPGMQSDDPMVAKTVYKLEAIEDQEGKKIARLATKTTASIKNLNLSGIQPQGAPQMNMSIDEISQNMTGHSWFSLTDGRLNKADMNVTMKEVMSFDTPQGKQKVTTDMKIKMSMNLK